MEFLKHSALSLLRLLNSDGDLIKHTFKRVFCYFRKPRFIATLCLSLWGISLSALADTSTETPHFTIQQYLIEGNSKVSTAQLNASVLSFTGEGKDFSTIESAVEAIRKAYKASGYEAVRVSIPKQEIDDGIVRLQVTEATISNVLIQGNKYFDEANLRHSLPALQNGEMPNIKKLGINLQLTNESFAKQTQVTFRQGQDPRTVEAVVNVADDQPWHAAISLDNTGTTDTGDWRLGFAYMNANMFNRDHTFSAQYVTSPDHLSDVEIFGLSYRIPLYSLGDAIELSASHSSVNSGVVNTTAGTYGISGSGDSFGAHYIYLLPRVADWDQRLNMGVDYRHFSNSVKLQGGAGDSLVPDLEIHPISLSYIGSVRGQDREWGGGISLHHNIPGGQDGKASDLQQVGARPQANPTYSLVRYDAHITQSLPAAFKVHAEFSGQYTKDALISGEQFGIGGSSSVRGFHERVIANDYGHQASVELHTPDFGHLIKTGKIKLSALAFYDFAVARRNHAALGEATQNHISSAGFGIRSSIGTRTNLRFDIAKVLDDDTIGNDGDVRAHVNLMVLF